MRDGERRIQHDDLAPGNGTAYGPEFDPYLRLVEAIFAGPYGKSPMPSEARIKWAQQCLPKTFGLLTWRETI